MPDRVVVLIAFPPQPPADLVSRLEAVSGSVEVVACAYEEGHDRRTARGRGEPSEVARHPPPDLTDDQQAAFQRAHVLLALDVPEDLPALAPDVRWVQAIGAGVDHYRGAGLDNVVVTNAAGVAAVPIAEFVIARLLEVWKHLHQLADLQRSRMWRPTYGRLLSGSTVGLVGLGAIGTAVAERTRALGMRVLAIRRNPSAPSTVVDELYGPEQLHDVLRRSDAVVLTAPSTPETANLFDARAFASMRPGAVFCNVARGALVDEVTLEALRTGHLGAAILDVTKQEPLPPDSALWDAPHLYLSPHSAASLDGYLERLFDLFADNLGRFLRGEPLRNVVDLTAGY